MTHVGYGVTFNGKPVGIWPVNQEVAVRAQRKYKTLDPKARVEIVTVHMGDAVSIVALPDGTVTGATA